MKVPRGPARARCRFLAAVFATLLLAAACTPAGDTWDDLQRRGILRIGLDPTFPPFELDAGGRLEGLDVDLARALAADLGLEPEFAYFGFDGLYDGLLTGQVDVLLSALVISPERTRDFAYTASYFDAGQRLVAPEGSPLQDDDSLAGATLAVELGSEGHLWVTTLARRTPGVEALPHESVVAALDAVRNGAADATVVEHLEGALALRDRPDLVFLGEPLTSEPFAAVVRIEDRRLLAALDESLIRLRRSGELEAIVDHWLGPAPASAE